MHPTQKHPKEAKYAFFSSAHGPFSKINHIIEHKTSLTKFKNTEIISRIFSDHNGLNLETNHKEKIQKHSNSWRLKTMLLNNDWLKSEIKLKIKMFLETNEKFSLPCHKSSPPWLPVSAHTTRQDECFLFNSLIVGLSHSLIFCQFWLFFCCCCF